MAVDAEVVALPLLAVGYPVAIVVIARWVPVVRERRTTWFLTHNAAMIAVVVGWAIRRPSAVAPNVAWLGASTIWYWAGSRRRR